jgi:predicted molibdopterin-dependent oxidoreductase YjgC
MRRLDGSANRELIAVLAKALSAKVLPLLSRANDRGAMEIGAALGPEGLSASEILAAAQNEKLDLLYLVGEDLPPGTYHAKHVIYQGMFLPAQVGKVADVIFPVASFAEVSGTYTNLEGRVQRVQQAAKYAMGTMSEWEVFAKIAEKLKLAGFEHTDSAELMNELTKSVPFFAGCSHKGLDSKDSAFFGKTKGAKQTLTRPPVAETKRPKRAKLDKEYPFCLISEYDEFVYKATPISAEVVGLGKIEPGLAVTLNPEDAEAMGVADKSPVNLVSRRGHAIVKAVHSLNIPRGVIRTIARDGEGSTVPLHEFALDPTSKVPEELCAVRIEKL